MALTENKIGEHAFIALRGEPIPPMQTTMIDDRPGVDGSETLLTGFKGRPFSMVSQADAESYAEAKQLVSDYALLIEGDAVTLVHGGVTSDSLGYRVLILNVEPISVRTIRGGVGNLISQAAEAFVECRWDLLAVPFEEPTEEEEA
jgi:hypothetical protein